MQTLNQLKIGNIVYDLAAKFDAEDNNIKDTYSTKEYVTQKISELVNSAPETLDTLNELAAALNNDSNFANTIITQLGTKVDKVEGKQLSTNDFTNESKAKLDKQLTVDDIQETEEKLFMSPIERPLIHIFSPVLPKTNDAVTSLIVSNSSAALAHNKLTSL